MLHKGNEKKMPTQEAMPSQDTTGPSQDTTRPSQDTTRPSQNTARPRIARDRDHQRAYHSGVLGAGGGAKRSSRCHA